MRVDICEACHKGEPLVWIHGPEDQDSVVCLDCWCDIEEAAETQGVAGNYEVVSYAGVEQF